ncbi:Crp/Fnr family transcriptional regulator [Limosilactobacillus agrestimuris]|uniref:Crp/Fnr family transcriptional regulator n=1 Tax=Limosilactobacillus agrestimuris TaxID=2941331 RepID=UPI00203F340E|nr:Crp/Fnr family transcriptional regulator [Limosilactobacillus agrestimuris]
MAEELCVQLVPLFNHLELTKQRQIEHLVHHQNVTKGTIVIQPSESKRLVIVKQGRLRLYQLNPAGEEQLQRIITTGEYVGETWLLGMKNTNSYVEADTKSEICILHRNDFLHLLQEQTDISFKLLEEQAGRVISLRYQVQLMALPTIGERLLTYLNHLTVIQGSSTIRLPMKMKDLSSYLGTTPETLSRQFSQLRSNGKIIRNHHQITLTNQKAN